MVNSHNLCIFEGRISSDPKYQTINGQNINGQNGAFEKATFSIAVDRQLTVQQKQAAKNNPNIQTADFVNCSITGKAVEVFKKYCLKGKAITVACTFQTYSYTDQQTGQKKYRYNFNVENFNFTIADAKGLQQNGGNNNDGNNGGFQQNNGFQNNGGYQQNNGFQNQNNGFGGQQLPFNNMPNQGQTTQNNGGNSNFEMFDGNNSASPF